MNHGTIYSVPQDRPPPPPSTVSPSLHQAVVVEIARQLLLQDFLRGSDGFFRPELPIRR